MNDPRIFEERIQAALGRYADQAPTDVDVQAFVRATRRLPARGGLAWRVARSLSPRQSERPIARTIPLVAGFVAIAVATVLGVAVLAPRPQLGVGSPGGVPSPSPVALAGPGPLEAGTYTSVDFDPGLRFTVPAGWELVADDPPSLLLRGPSDPNVGTVTCADTGPDWGDSCVHHENVITVMGDVILGSDDRDCEGLGQADFPRSAVDMIEALLSDARFVTDGQGQVTIGGLTGQAIDIELARTWTGTCKWSTGKPAALVLTTAEPPGPFLGVQGWEQIRLILLDSRDGIVAISIDPLYSWPGFEVIDTFAFG